MWRLLRKKFILPVSINEDTRRKEYILNIVLVASFLALSALDGLVLYHTFVRQPAYTGIPFAVFSIFPAFFAALLALSRRGYHATASYLLIAALLLGNAYASMRWGIDLPVTLLAYAFIICTASILLGNRVGFIVTLLIAAAMTGIWTIHLQGIMTPEPQYPTEDDIVILGAFYFLIMTVSWLSNREIEKSLTRARTSERALKEERDLLEVRVDERTEELRKAQFEEIAHVHRLAEFGQLSSGLFHDLLSLLTAISLRTEGYAEDESSLAAAYETTRQIRQFMQAVQEQLGKDNTRESFSLREGIAQAMKLVTYKANKEGVRISMENEDGDPLIYEGIPFRFHQIIINLLTNAIDAYRGLPQDGDRRREVLVRAEAQGESFTVSVRDFGCGMPDDIREKVFTPFFTTKGKMEGIGIGLATVKKTIEEDFRGTITVSANENKGSLFTVKFPKRMTPSLKQPLSATHNPIISDSSHVSSGTLLPKSRS